MIRRQTIPVKTGGATDPGAWWGMAVSKSDAEAGNGIFVAPQDADWIALDPAQTSPHVIIACSTGGGTFALVPGAPLPVKRGARISLWNVSHAVFGGSFPHQLAGSAPVITPLGRVQLVTGSEADLPTWHAYSNRADYAGPKSLGLIKASVALNGTIFFPTNGIRKLRVTVDSGDAAGAQIAPPAAFSATLVPNVRTLALVPTGDALDTPVGSVGTASIYEQAGITYTFVPGALNPGQYREIDVVPAWCHGFRVSALAGAGVGTAIIYVEGVR